MIYFQLVRFGREILSAISGCIEDGLVPSFGAGCYPYPQMYIATFHVKALLRES